MTKMRILLIVRDVLMVIFHYFYFGYKGTIY